MRRVLAAFVLLLAFAEVAASQSVRITPMVGGTEPRGGSLVMWVPIAATVGFDSLPQRYTYEKGRSYGVLLEWDRAGWLDFSALGTVNQGRRGYATPSGSGTCDGCESTIVGVGLLAGSRWNLHRRIELSLAAGPEALFFSGDAVTTGENAPPPTEVAISPRWAIGGVAAAGMAVRTRPGEALRVTLAYRGFEPKYESSGSTSFESVPIRQLAWTVGYTFTVRGAR